MALISLVNICKKFPDGVVAVSNFSLDIEAGEFIVLVGPSGCGKSTTLKMIAGLEEISDGTLEIEGIMANDLAPNKRNIGMVFQNYALFPHMSVYQNIGFGLRLRKLKPETKDRIIRNTARMLNLEKYLDRKPQALSGGQQQRVAMGRAIARNPNILLMDEPLSNLDAKLRLQMRAEIARIHRELEATIIYVTHDQVEAMTLATRVVVMNEGEIQQVDTPLNIYNNPANLFVAGFIGTPVMNFFDGRIVKADNVLKIQLATGDEFDLDRELGALVEKSGYVDKVVVCGIRPEAIRESQSCDNAGSYFLYPSRIEALEILGSDTYIHFKMGSVPIVARESWDRDLAVAQEIVFAFDVSRIHLFDKTNGKIIQG